jgi:hypothetical protein
MQPRPTFTVSAQSFQCVDGISFSLARRPSGAPTVFATEAHQY